MLNQPWKYRWLTFGAFALIVATRLYNLDVPLLDHHSFRQTQTALTAYWFAKEGVVLPNYPLPLFGPPWTAPFEFPTYQLMVAGMHRLGVPLDVAARLVAISAFMAAVAIFWRLLRCLGAPVSWRFGFLTFCAFSPFAITWSRACMIDFSSVAFSGAFLALCHKAFRSGWTPLIGGTALLVGCFATLTKITTAPVYWTAAAALALAAMRKEWLLSPDESITNRSRRTLTSGLKWAAVLGLPLVAAILWTVVTDQIKLQSPATASLTSGALKSWNFGTLAQRATSTNWLTIGSRISTLIVPWTWPLIGVGLVVTAKREEEEKLVIFGLAVGSLVTVALFFNLYVVHDYYLCAIAFPLWIFAARGMASLADLIPWSSGKLLLSLGLVLVLAGTSLNQDYVLGSFIDSRKYEIYRFCSAAKNLVPEGDEIIVAGDFWSSRLPYYCERKALMVDDTPGGLEQAALYAQQRGVRYLIGVAARRNQLVQRWPAAREIFSTANCTLYELPNRAGASPP